MSTVVWPRMFELEYAPLHHDSSGTADPKKLRELLKKFEINLEATPVALRWRVHPDLGFPREPFQVFRRMKTRMPVPKNLGVAPGTVSNGIVHWGNIPQMDVILQLDVAVPVNGKIEALDEHMEPILGEFVLLSGSSGALRFHHPNICALQINGTADIVRVLGVSMHDYANDRDWKLIEEVGLPYQHGEVSPPMYDARLQGKPGDLKPGDEAARDRLMMGLVFSERPPFSAPGGQPVPAWLVPDPADVVDEIRQAGSTLELISKMLDRVNPDDFIGNQTDYTETIPNDGISQEGGSAGSDPSEFDLRTGPMFLLGASSDIHPALGLGFGTTDFPDPFSEQKRFTEPDRSFDLPYDYMVAVTYQLPFGLKLRIAALGAPALMWPIQPGGLSISAYQRNRGILLDAPEKEDVKIEWQRQPAQSSPHGYYVSLLEGGDPPQFLNARRPRGAGFVPVIPATSPDRDVSHEAFVSYFDTNRTVPLTGSRNDLYEVFVQDVFGRCSNWNTISHALSPGGPDIPTVMELRFNPDLASAVGRSLPATLQVDLVWDWEDKGPSEIELVGMFFSTSSPGSAPTGLQFSSGGATSPSARLVFSQPAGGGNSEVPALTGATGTVVILPAESGDGEAVRYRITLPGFTLDFSSLSRLSYAVFARAREKVNPALPSPFSPAVSINVMDPLPAEPPLISPDLRWSSLPDATGMARYKVSFPAVPHADSYVVYEATEAAMRHAASLPPPADNALTTRVLDLQALPFSGRIVDTFSRLTRDPLSAPEIEVMLPGAVDGIFAYNVASLTAENVESERSGTIYVAVPKRSTPGAPTLRVNKTNVEGALEILVEAGTGEEPVAVEIFRTRAAMLSAELNKMGPPVLARDDAGWTRQDRSGTTVSVVNAPAAHFSILDTVTPGWYPYYYRAAAWGMNDPSQGIHPGRSASSAVVDLLLPPAAPPDLEELSVSESSDGSLWRVSFRSASEWRRPPIGPHLLTVSTFDRSAQHLAYHEITSLEFPAIELLSGSPAETDGQVYRKERGPDGRWSYDVYFAKGADSHIAIAITDPLERQTVLKTALELPESPPDLEDVSFRRFLFWLTIRFKSSVSIAPPADSGGGFLVETFDADSTPHQLLNRARIHQVGTSGGLGTFRRNASPDAAGRYSYSINRCIWFRTISRVAVKITSSSGLFTTKTS